MIHPWPSGNELIRYVVDRDSRIGLSRVGSYQRLQILDMLFPSMAFKTS